MAAVTVARGWSRTRTAESEPSQTLPACHSGCGVGSVRSMSLFVPIYGTGDGVRLPLDQLPDDVIAVVDVLRAEAAPLGLWLQLAVEYYKRGMETQFVTLLEEGTRDEIEQHYKAFKSERIGILSALGVYHTRSALKQIDKYKHDKCIELATQCFKKADAIDIHESKQWLGKSLMYLATGDLHKAELLFNSIIEKFPVNRFPSSIAALLGKGCVNFYKKDYKAGLASYCMALKANPECPSYVRLGIAICAFFMGDYRLSRLAFQRVLHLDAYNVDALVGLAVLEANSSTDSLHTSIQYLERAYSIDSNCALALSMIADHLFYQGDHANVVSLANRSLRNTTSEPLKSYNHYLIARSYHVQSEFAKARAHYAASCEISPSNMFALMGLSQMHIRDGDFSSASKALETIREKHPDDFDCVRLLGIVYARLGEAGKATTLLKRANELMPRNTCVLVELAQVLLHGPDPDRAAAKDLLSRAATQFEKRSSSVSFQLLNNIGVLCLDLGLYDEAATWLSKSSAAASSVYANSALPVPTIAFNEALLHEKRGQLKEAADIYSKILDTVPAYHECRIRLARNALKRADTDEAIRQLTAVLESNPEQIDALIELGRLYASSGKLHDAERQFTKVLTIAKNDAYGRISLASVFLMRAGQLKKIPQQFQSLLRKAGKLYYSALSRDPKNVYASNGLAVYLASRDNNEKARLILNDVREAAVFISSAWVNLAHLSVTEGAFDVATKLYETCLKKHYPQTPDNDIMTYLARAYYLKGDMLEAKRCLQRAIRCNPSSMMSWYNLALSCEDFAIGVLQRPKPQRNVHDVRRAVGEIEHAARIFGSLSTSGNADDLIRQKSSSHFLFCQSSCTTAKRHLEYAEKSEAKAREERRAAEISQAARRADEEGRMELEQRRAEDERKKIEEALQADRDKLARIQEAMQQRSRKRESDDGEESEEGDHETKTRKQRGKKKRKTGDLAEDAAMQDAREAASDHLAVKDGGSKPDIGADHEDDEADQVSRRPSSKRSKRVIDDENDMEEDHGEEI
ncbi:hypothetical protein PBRA_000858 [Plasmodiophora brassicae]|uniref:Uncharacterized protein n=1 Tax=Plasmodiophora brassicae TaxID=37360 RepID=A0A0G4IQ72_PLABS|nr:hypothetical protein PBRA_000858 [Plasmodiophora brassicae]